MQLEIKNLEKKYNQKSILSNLNLKIESGKVTSVIGPNGSGKTTLLNCLADVVNYNGLIIPAAKIRLNSLYFVQDLDKIESEFTGDEFVLLTSQLYKNWDKARYDKQLIFLLDLFDMTNHMRKKLKHYSHGMIKKISLIAAICTNTEIIILDEPFNGLDYEYQQILVQILKDLRTINKTIILSSHNLNYVQEVSDIIHILHNSVLIYDVSKNSGVIKQSHITNLESIFLNKTGLINKIKYSSNDFIELF